MKPASDRWGALFDDARAHFAAFECEMAGDLGFAHLDQAFDAIDTILAEADRPALVDRCRNMVAAYRRKYLDTLRPIAERPDRCPPEQITRHLSIIKCFVDNDWTTTELDKARFRLLMEKCAPGVWSMDPKHRKETIDQVREQILRL